MRKFSKCVLSAIVTFLVQNISKRNVLSRKQILLYLKIYIFLQGRGGVAVTENFERVFVLEINYEIPETVQ